MTRRRTRNQLRSAITKRDFALIETFFDEGWSIDRRLSRNEDTCLILAAEQGQLDLFESIMSHGPNIDLFDGCCETALHKAADFDTIRRQIRWNELESISGYESDWNYDVAVQKVAGAQHRLIARRLIDAGAQIDLKNHWGRTPLLLAAHNGDSELVRALIDAGADINTEDNEQETVLMYAVEVGHEDIVEMLIAAGADVNATTDEGLTVLRWARDDDARKINVRKMLIGAGARKKVFE
jgi:ankyrin repeat protein